jgi:hypothetical protein
MKLALSKWTIKNKSQLSSLPWNLINAFLFKKNYMYLEMRHEFFLESSGLFQE